MDVARHANSNKIAQFKNHLFKTQRWNIALSLPSTKPNIKKKNYVPKEYRKVLVEDPIDPDDPDKFNFIMLYLQVKVSILTPLIMLLIIELISMN